MRSPLGKIPVLQRGGSIVPRKERARRSSSLMVRDPYTLVVALDHLVCEHICCRRDWLYGWGCAYTALGTGCLNVI